MKSDESWTSGEAGGGTGGVAPRATRMPRWVKLAAVVTAAAIVVLVVLMLAGVGGQHGPGRHKGGSHAVSRAAVIGANAITSASVGGVSRWD